VNSSLDNVCGLLRLGYGDQFRLENIKQRLENGDVLYVSDNNYLIKLVHQYRGEIQNAGEYKKPEPNIGGESKVLSSKIIPNENTPPKLEINEKQENPIFCINCGKKNPQGAKFCGGCGSSTNSPPPNSPPPNSPPPNSPPPNSPPPNSPPPNSPPPNSPPPNNYNQYQRPMQWKNEGTVLLITVIFGIFGYGGIGHIYLGKIGKGIVLLIVGTILLVISLILLFMMMPFIIVLWIFAIWVVFNARSDCRKYNETMERTGRPPQ
jgi:TM2 domain-containing membrane protein YozV/ribosomal protein L40E